MGAGLDDWRRLCHRYEMCRQRSLSFLAVTPARGGIVQLATSTQVLHQTTSISSTGMERNSRCIAFLVPRDEVIEELGFGFDQGRQDVRPIWLTRLITHQTSLFPHFLAGSKLVKDDYLTHSLRNQSLRLHSVWLFVC